MSEEEKEKSYPRSSKGYGSSGWSYEYKGSSYQIQNGKEVNPIFRTSKIDKALFSNDKILKD